MLSTSARERRVFRASICANMATLYGTLPFTSTMPTKRSIRRSARGAQPLEEPRTVTDEYGSIRRAAIQTYGDTIHSLISFEDYAGPFLPGFKAADAPGR